MASPAVIAAALAASSPYDPAYVTQAASSYRQALVAQHPDLDFTSGYLAPYWPAFEQVHAAQLAQTAEHVRETTARQNWSTGFAVGAMFAVAAFAILNRAKREPHPVTM
jgi:hypothetical protein